MDTKIISIDNYQLEFKLTMTINDAGYTVVNRTYFESISGVYIVFIGDVWWYTGKFSNSFQRRWVNKGKRCNQTRIHRHFKYETLVEAATELNDIVRVYSCPQTMIFNTFNNPLINFAGIEQALIERFPTILNKVGVR